jgi:Spy/CpxP family protein refolding chaperone
MTNRSSTRFTSLVSSVATIAALAAAPAFALGCGGAQATVSQPGATRAPVAPSTSSDIKVFTEALGDVPLTGSQRGEIDHLAADADGRHASIAAARKALELALADQVDAGHVDRAALEPKIDAIVAAVQATQAPDRAAFERLHAILDPDQRVAFVNALEAHMHDRMGEMRHGGGRMREWADALKLTDDQRGRIRTMMKDEMEKSHSMQEMTHHAERGAKILGAFKADRFVFDEVAPQQDLHEPITTGVDRFLDLANQVLPLLTPEQRTAASQRLRSKADSIGFGP